MNDPSEAGHPSTCIISKSGCSESRTSLRDALPEGSPANKAKPDFSRVVKADGTRVSCRHEHARPRAAFEFAERALKPEILNNGQSSEASELILALAARGQITKISEIFDMIQDIDQLENVKKGMLDYYSRLIGTELLIKEIESYKRDIKVTKPELVGANISDREKSAITQKSFGAIEALHANETGIENENSNIF